jgi:hypothetical protein
MQRIEQAALNAGPGGSQHRICPDRVGIIGAAQTQQPATARVQRRRQALEAAFARHFQPELWIILAVFQRSDVKRQFGMVVAIPIDHAAVIDGQHADGRKIDGLVLVLLVEDPVGHAIPTHLKQHVRLGQRDFGKFQPADQKLEEVDRELQALDLGHRGVGAPRGIPEDHVVGNDARPPRKMHAQIAVDGDASASARY